LFADHQLLKSSFQWETSTIKTIEFNITFLKMNTGTTKATKKSVSSEGHRGHLLPAVAVFNRTISLGLIAYSGQDFLGCVPMRVRSCILHVSYVTRGSQYFSLTFTPRPCHSLGVYTLKVEAWVQNRVASFEIRDGRSGNGARLLKPSSVFPCHSPFHHCPTLIITTP
jgi:hypothetical protein